VEELERVQHEGGAEVKQTPLKRKTPLRAGKPKPKRVAWIAKKPKVDESRMDCCPEAIARAEALVLLPCACGCGSYGRERGDFPDPLDMCIHHLSNGAGMSRRSIWYRTINLLRMHHEAVYPYSTHGRDRAKFHADNGTEAEMLARTNAQLPPELCAAPSP